MTEGSRKDFLQTAFSVDDFQGLGRHKIWRLINVFLSEFFATAVTVFLLCAVVQGTLFNHKQDHLTVGLTAGFAVGTSVLLFGHVSGSHINPALSLAAVILGEMSFALALLYTVAQCLGSTFAYALTRAILPSSANFPEKDYSARCCTVPDDELSAMQAVLTEAIATGILTLAFCSALDKRNLDKHDSLPLKFAIVIIALALPVALYSGCSVNPARSFGPAFYNQYWENHWIYWVGPLLGSAVCSIVYRIIFDPANMEITSSEIRRDPATINLRNNSHKFEEDA
jgi:aquaporin related protein